MKRFKKVVSLMLVFALLCSMSANAAWFEDVKDGEWYADAVNFAVASEIFSGVSEKEFAPNMQITRAMLVTVLHRMDGEKESDFVLPFDDVSEESWYFDAVRWATSEKIVNGVSEKKFSPETNITREQLATILLRFASYKGYDVSAENTDISSFEDDGSVSSFAKNGVAYAVGSGLIAGKTPTTINPKDTATRAEAATILQRFLKSNKGEFSIYNTPIKFGDPFAPEPQKITAKELQCRRYEDEEKFYEAIEKFNALKTAENATIEEVSEVYEYLYNEMLEIYTLTTLSMYFRDQDTRNAGYFEIYNHNNAVLVGMKTAFTEAVESFAKSGRFGEEFDELIGEDVANVLRASEDVDYAKLEELMSRSTELLNEYESVLYSDVSVEYKGETWTRYDETKTPESEEDLKEIRRLIDDKLYEMLVPIYIELNETRREEAKFWGFDSQSDYYNAMQYSRDYDTADVKKILANVKKHIVPIIREFGERPESEKVESYEIIGKARTVIESVSPEMLEVFDDMTERELVFIGTDLGKSRSVAYTTCLAQYASPIIYMYSSGDYFGIDTLVHEFGHYCDFYLNETRSLHGPVLSLDTTEIFSTALEFLAYDVYEDIYVDPTEEKIILLQDGLNTIVYTACQMEANLRVDEYEGELTGDVIKQIYRETAEEYGIPNAFEQGYEWIDIMQIYRMPFYNMSYVAAGIAALEIWAMSREEGQDAAEQLYLEMLSDGSLEYGYMQLMYKHGLRGAVSEQAVKDIAETVSAELATLSK